LASGTYRITVTDTAGASAYHEYTVAQNSVISITGGATTNVLINGAATGSIAEIFPVGGTGTYTYSWTKSSGASSISYPTLKGLKSNLKAGTYTVTILDSAGATLSQAFIITQNDVINISSGTIQKVLIYGAATGSVSGVTLTGGTGTYSSYWTGLSELVASTTTGQTLSSREELVAGSYVLNVTDNAGAVCTKTYVVTQNPILKLKPGVVRHNTMYASRGGYIGPSTITGGDGTYYCQWTRSENATALTNPNSWAEKRKLKPGTYYLSVWDGAGATASATLVVKVYGGRIYGTTGKRTYKHFVYYPSCHFKNVKF
jgi:hypothetical protein